MGTYRWEHEKRINRSSVGISTELLLILNSLDSCFPDNPSHLLAHQLIPLLEGIQCRGGTSCPDQLATALELMKAQQKD